jgi:hypothetical protein
VTASLARKATGAFRRPFPASTAPPTRPSYASFSTRGGFEEEGPGNTFADQTAAQGSNADQSVDAANCSSGGKDDRNENAKGVGPCSWR